MIILRAVAPTINRYVYIYMLRWVSVVLTDFIAVDMLPNNTFSNQSFTSCVLPKQAYVRFALWFEV